jgi:hypothetical protein
VLSDRVHQQTRQRLRDVTVGGRELEVVLVKRQFACVEPLCPRRTFAQVTDQVPLRARVTRRLRELVLEAVVDRGRAVSAAAAEHALTDPSKAGHRWRRYEPWMTGAATATPPTTRPVSAWPVPPARQGEHPASALHHIQLGRA